MDDKPTIQNEIDKHLVITSTTTDSRLLSMGKDGVNAFTLYHFYCVQTKIQGTKKVWITDEFCRRGLHWGKLVFARAKKILLEQKMIEETSQAAKGKKSFQKKYIVVKFIAFASNDDNATAISSNSDSAGQRKRWDTQALNGQQMLGHEKGNAFDKKRNAYVAPGATGDTEEFDFNAKLREMEKDKRRHIRIIAYYWKEKKFVFENEKQYRAALERELKPAAAISGYETERIIKVIEWLKQKFQSSWKLTTVHKYIDEPDLSKAELPQKQRPYYQGMPMRQVYGKWQVLANGEWKEYADKESLIEFK